MKKFCTILLMLFGGFYMANCKDIHFMLEDAKDLADTVVLSKPMEHDIKFDIDVYTSKSGDVKTYYYCYIDGVVYSTNKSTYDRWQKYVYYNLTPGLAIIKRGKGKARVVIL